MTISGTLVTYGLYTTSANARAGQSLSLIREFLGFQWQKLRWAWFGEAGKRMVFYSITDMREQHPDWFREDLTALFDLVRRGQLAPSIWRTLPLSEAAQAHRMIESGEVRGKIVLESQP